METLAVHIKYTLPTLICARVDYIDCIDVFLTCNYFKTKDNSHESYSAPETRVLHLKNKRKKRTVMHL